MIQLVNVGGIPNQPALDICNDTLQTLLSAPNNWKFNKAGLPEFTTVPNQQDYWVSGATATVDRKAAVSINAMLADPPGLIPDDEGNVLVNFDRFAPDGIQGVGTSSQPPLFAVGDQVEIQGAGNGVYNGRFTIVYVPSKTSFVYELGETGLLPDGGQGINSYGWMEHATLEDYLSTAWVKPKRDIIVVSSLYNESLIQPPFKVCMQFERVLSCGNQANSELLIRFFPVPSSQIWRALLFYQLKAQVKTSLEDNWFPWPDDLAYVLRSGVYSKALEHGEDPRSVTAVQLWQQDIARALGIRQQEERHEAYFPDLPILRGG
ncbi:MAG: hypothetical protein C5B60_07935 [Chloroflexi bacterium]|nr:MAG: hypothetical protein C5B60_07935 [Chloroflexota bacterium]